jgi:L-cysteine desulfidase
MLDSKRALEYVKKNVFDTIGCTEPVAVAYAAAAAYSHLGGLVRKVEVEISVNIFKNGMAVGIPGSSYKGISFAVALGLTAGEWEKGLRLFENVKAEDMDRAYEMSRSGIIRTFLTKKTEKVYVLAKVFTDKGSAEAEIRGSHGNLLFVKVDGRTVYGTDTVSLSTGDQSEPKSSESGSLDPGALTGLGMEELVAAVEGIPEEELDFLGDALEINRAAAEAGLVQRSGMGLGAGIGDLVEEGILGDSLATEVEKYVAAAADSRMSGMLVPIKGCGGSGNHGIAYFLGTGLAWERYREKAVKSLNRTYAMGLLLVQYIKGYTGLLTPTCGVTVSAAPAIAASVVYAFGGGPAEMTAAVNLVMGNIAGILCDGAKHGCALKAATGARFGVQSAFLALKGVRIPESDGIVGKDLPSSFAQFRTLQEKGLSDADAVMLEILLKKNGIR